MRSHARLIFVIGTALIATSGRVYADPKPERPDGALKDLQLPDVKITSVTQGHTKSRDGTHEIAYYDVDGVISGTIKFELLLPEEWNKRFLMGGGGGFGGKVENCVRSSVKDGYATVGTDTGHQGEGFDASFALDNALALVNFGHLAVHRTAEVAKAIIREYYGVDAQYSYFVGGSRGGGQGMMESQRYPKDFDGIVCGVPAFDWVGLGALFLRGAQVFYPDPKVLDKTLVTKEELDKLHADIMAQCDEQDGLKDGIISDPFNVRFSLDSITWLSAEQRKALQALYDGVRNQDGQIQPGVLVGSEREWILWHVGPMRGFPVPTAGYAFGSGFKYLVFNDPNWNYSKYDFSTYEKDTRLARSTLSAVDADLSAFRDNGGKLIIWHGLEDGGLSPKTTVNYYDKLLARDPNASDYTRLYLMPGIGHGGQGAGPALSHEQWLDVIVRWVEQKQAPDTIIATKPTTGGDGMSRLLSPYPKRTVYKGSGDPNKASSFESVAP